MVNILSLVKQLNSDDPEASQEARNIYMSLNVDDVIPAFINIATDKDEDLSLRGFCIQELSYQFAESAVEPFINLLSDEVEDSYIKNLIIDLLGYLGDKRALKPILQLSDNKSLLLSTVYALSGFEEKEAKEQLFKLLDKYIEYNAYRFYIVCALAGDKRVIPDLLVFLLHNYNVDRYQRYTAANMLGQFGDKRAIPILLGTLQDQDDLVVRSSAGALSALKATEAVLTLIYKMQEATPRNATIFVPALGLLGDKVAVEPLIERLKGCLGDNTKREARDEYSKLREAIAVALCQLGDKRAIPVLEQALKLEMAIYPPTRFDGVRAIKGALFGLGQDQYLNELDDIFENRGFPYDILVSSGRLSREQVVNIARNMLLKENERSHGVALSILGDFGEQKEVPLITDFVAHKRKVGDSSIRNRVRKAVKQINNRKSY